MRKFFKQAHIWFSLPLGVVISIVCFTGAMLIFEKEITEVVQRDYYYVANSEGEPLSVEEVVALVEPTLEEGRKITGVTISHDPERSYKVNVNTPKHAAIFVDQYSGEVLGEPGRVEFFMYMFRLHRWLMDERPENESAVYWGKVIVGISTLALVVIILTGVVLWIPKSVKMWKNRSQISLRKGWRRFLYDLHVAGGIYATLLILTMALTGLTWSFEWYRNGLYRLFGADTTVASSHSAAPRAERDGSYSASEIAFEDVVARYDEYNNIVISPTSIAVNLSGFGNPRAADKYSFDASTGAITSAEMYADASRQQKMRGWIYALHVGNFGGYITRVLWFLAALLGATLPLTGYYLWIKRTFTGGKK
jgi:uncharacterized iron-regulated membrane protein